jgi:nanoRNase/pAp phosphatase (c-di-AMP/oligoRNAs hydrolase)|tara:strand:- start:3521 stop:4492 length:972 start_codon:yes stop_codon:yes gene_type:complete
VVPVPAPDPAALEAALARELLLLVHHHGDADSVGCAIALAEAFPGARISATDGLSAAGKVMAERLEVEIEPGPPASWDGTVVVIDTSSPEHCAPLPTCRSVVVIDHHQTAGEWPAGTLLIHEPEAKSTAEIVTRLIPELGIELTPQMALPLLAGVYADTGHFRHATHDSFAAAQALTAAGGEPRQAMVLLDRVRPQQQRTTFLKAAQRLKFSQEGKWLLATTRTGSFESGTARLMVALGADVALAASGNRKGQVRISSRASSAAIEAGLNLAQLLEALADEQSGSAGGHPGAAGFQARGDPDALLAMARRECIAQLKSLAEGA